MRSPTAEDLQAVLVVGTLGAPQRRLLRGRRGRAVEQVGAEPVPTSRATVVRPQGFDSPAEARDWLAGLRGDRRRADEELHAAVRHLNRAIHAHRVAAADPWEAEVSPERALVVRIGFGAGDELAEGRFEAGWELPHRRSRAKRSMEAPEERFAAILGGRSHALACEELVLRARADLQAGRHREAALQARVALESLLAELRGTGPPNARAELEADREPMGAAANSALRGELTDDEVDALGEAVGRMEAALRRHRLGGT